MEEKGGQEGWGSGSIYSLFHRKEERKVVDSLGVGWGAWLGQNMQDSEVQCTSDISLIHKTHSILKFPQIRAKKMWPPSSILSRQQRGQWLQWSPQSLCPHKGLSQHLPYSEIIIIVIVIVTVVISIQGATIPLPTTSHSTLRHSPTYYMLQLPPASPVSPAADQATCPAQNLLLCAKLFFSSDPENLPRFCQAICLFRRSNRQSI